MAKERKETDKEDRLTEFCRRRPNNNDEVISSGRADTRSASDGQELEQCAIAFPPLFNPHKTVTYMGLHIYYVIAECLSFLAQLAGETRWPSTEGNPIKRLVIGPLLIIVLP